MFSRERTLNDEVVKAPSSTPDTPSSFRTTASTKDAAGIELLLAIPLPVSGTLDHHELACRGLCAPHRDRFLAVHKHIKPVLSHAPEQARAAAHSSS
jgi:hypothetical protein